MPKKNMKQKPSSAMQQRIASLEKKLAGKLAAHAKPGKKRAKNSSNPVGPRSRGPRRGGALGLGSGVSGATTRRAQVISEDEYIGEVAGSVGFAVSQYPCNPGQASTFPWGNRIAALYEEYDFEMLEFYYKREVSEFATNGQAGKVILSFDYDASDLAPTSKQQVEDTVPHQDGMPCTPIIRLSIDCARLRKNPAKYVRPGAQPANTDIKTYDCGTLNVSTQGNTNTSTIGELRVRYRCRLSEPVLEAPAVLGQALHLTTSTATTANNFAGMVATVGSSPSLLAITATTNGLVFPKAYTGNYLVITQVSGATSSGSMAGNGWVDAAGGSGALFVTALNLFNANAGGAATSGYLSSLASTTASQSISAVAVTIASPGGVMPFGPVTIVTSGAGSVDTFVFPLPSTLVTASVGSSSSCSSSSPFARCGEAKLARMYAKLCELGCIDEDETPGAAGDDDVVRVDANDPQLSISTSAPPPSVGSLSMLTLKRK